MEKLKVDLKNCYGIQSLEEEFDFSTSKGKTYAIYAPNGLMKTSFTKTFEKLANGQQPEEERYNRPSTYEVKADGVGIAKEMICVLKSEIDISSDSPAITNILVDPVNKSRYDTLLIDIDKQKNKLIGSLQKLSKVKKTEVEKIILADWNESDFPTCISKILEITIDDDLSPYEYNTIFDPKAIEVLKSQEFISKAKEFTDKYEELFNQAGTIYQKGIFNPIRQKHLFRHWTGKVFLPAGIVYICEASQTQLTKQHLMRNYKRYMLTLMAMKN